MKLSELIKRDGIEVAYTYQGKKRSYHGWPHHSYKCELKMNNTSAIFPYQVGLSHSKNPTTSMVLRRLLADATCVIESGDFEAWAIIYDYDVNSHLGEALYRQSVILTAELRAFLGDKFDEYMAGADEL